MSRIGVTAGRGLLVITILTALVGGAPRAAHADPPPATFLPLKKYATAEGPTGVGIADFNGDGHQDLASSNESANNISVRLGTAAGGFGPRTDFATGLTPTSMATADLNGDTLVDIVAPNEQAGTVSVLLGDGDGGFTAHVDHPAGVDPRTIAVGDFDDDSVPDVAVADSGQGALLVLFGDGTGDLGSPVSVPGAEDASEVIARDVDGDGVPDLIAAGQFSIWVALADGIGGFEAFDEFDAGVPAVGVAAADLDGNETLDVAVAGLGSNQVSVLMGDGTGGFGPPALHASSTFPESVLAADLNGDTFVDLVTANALSDDISVLLGEGGGAFAAQAHVAAGDQPSALAAGILDGDLRPDIAVANPLESTVSVLLSDIAPTAPTAPTIIRNATAGHQQATVSWTAPASDGGSPITGYVVTPYVGFFGLTPTSFSSTATTQTITGLTNGTEYRFRVQAVNAVGTSGHSMVSNPVTPSPTAPSPPTIITNATAGDGEATVSWIAPVSDGGSVITSYVVTPYIGFFGLSPVVFDASVTTRTVTGFTNGTTYRFRVRAVNAIGTSGYSKVTNPVTPTGG
jgi:hypothetical protein